MALTSFANRFSVHEAKEYWLHGVCRRHSILHRAMHNIFEILPIHRTALLEDEERMDLEINLHAFLINLVGAADNLALCIGFERGVIGPKDEGKMPQKSVTLFERKFRNRLPEKLRDRIASTNVLTWHRNYAKGYRDALAHRIPPYVPPAGLTNDEQEIEDGIVREINSLTSDNFLTEFHGLMERRRNLGRLLPVFGHSRYDGSPSMLLHPQMVADTKTIELLIDEVMAYFMEDAATKGSHDQRG